MRSVRFIPQARREFLTAAAFYEEAHPRLGADFIRDVEQAAGRTVAFPLAGTSSIADTRWISLRNFPFTLFYRPDSEGSVILAVARPSHWNFWGGLASGR